MFSIFAQNGCGYHVEQDCDISELVTYDDDQILFFDGGHGVMIGIYETEARAAEIVDEIVNAFYSGKNYFRLPPS